MSKRDQRKRKQKLYELNKKREEARGLSSSAKKIGRFHMIVMGSLVVAAAIFVFRYTT